ncbi:Platelet-derived growth factor subunit A, partial [Stegodyphus mimosarum]
MIPWLTEFVLIVATLLAVFCSPLSRRTEVPEDFLIRLQTVQNISQFLNSWIDQAAVQRAYLLQDDDDSERTVEVAHPAGCIPEMQIVEFERPYDPSLVIWPICTRVRRCGGCCSSKLLHCVATRKSSITVKVIKARYPHPEAEMLELEGYENVKLEQHDRCACKCRQEEQDCTPKQKYQPGQCRCVCRNQHDAGLCKQPEQLWDNKDCECKCRHQSDCSTGSVFNVDKCKCEALDRTSPPLLERVPGPAPHLSTLLKDDGGENDAYRLRYSGIAPDSFTGHLSLAQYQQENREFLLENVTLP